MRLSLPTCKVLAAALATIAYIDAEIERERRSIVQATMNKHKLAFVRGTDRCPEGVTVHWILKDLFSYDLIWRTLTAAEATEREKAERFSDYNLADIKYLEWRREALHLRDAAYADTLNPGENRYLDLHHSDFTHIAKKYILLYGQKGQP